MSRKGFFCGWKRVLKDIYTKIFNAMTAPAATSGLRAAAVSLRANPAGVVTVVEPPLMIACYLRVAAAFHKTALFSLINY